MNFQILDAFLENCYIPLYGATFLISLWKYSKYYDTSLKFLPVLLLYTFLNELLGEIVADSTIYSLSFQDMYSNYNIVIYNIYNVVFFLYFYYIFWSYLEKKIHRKSIAIGSVVFMVTSLVNPFLQNLVIEPQLYSYVVGAVLLICCIILYFIEILGSSKILYVKEDLLFWISIGLLLFYVGYIPIKLTRYFFAIENVDVYMNLRRVHLILIVIMYGCFITGFLWMKRRLRD
ncbi:hypothetical protein K8352_13790 [Flavobacteriaceae bacterium F89]|uniref:Uncharacterized protein n=1 Tax=Cerina litoralis TaxID=2874477 RepID=A0AAE3EYA9_9FLAO|nr:hypothetical protein [Cerina litoralis]MCG2461826.1 hypothetical protein [Cerina litoralis]